jgi:hypothetical protein
MRKLLLISVLLATLALSFANSYLFSLEQKVAACTAILRVSVTELIPPQSASPLDPAICKAKVLEMLKGPENLKDTEFRFSSYGAFSRDKLPEMVGKEFIVFLHEPPLPNRLPYQQWVFEGPKGIRPIAKEYQEYKITSDKKITTETFSHDDYLAAIRKFASIGSSSKKTRTL